MDTIIHFKEVSKHFNEVPILKDISFTAKKKDVIGLIGPNGAGKTTIIRLILGSLHADSGEVEVFGSPNRSEVREKNREIGFVLDRHGFDAKATAAENIYFYSRLYHVAIPEARKRMEKMVDVLGLEINIDAPVNTYSKGMVQQLAILKSLIHKPRLLILDEPNSGLDPVMRTVIHNLITNLSKLYEVTILVSSHNLHELENVCNKFIIINKGELKLFSDKKIAHANSNYKAIFALQRMDKPIDGEFFKPLLENNTLLSYRVLDEKVICELKDPKDAYNIHSFLEENQFPVSHSQVRKTDIEDMYFEIIGEDRYAKNTNIY
jgi:ABC-2 type transport system ATP-binding protein